MNIEKLVQAVSYLLKKNKYRLNYTKLIKILYLADRASLDRINRSMTGDTYAALPNGPILNELYSLIRGKSRNREHQCFWDGRFSTDGYDLVSLSDKIPEGKLSRFEKKVLDQLDKQFHATSYDRVIDFVHDPKNCPEWRDPGTTSIPISLSDILSSLGRSSEEIEQILQEESTYADEERILESLAVL